MEKYNKFNFDDDDFCSFEYDFELDLRYHNFYCNYELIWTFLRDKYFFDYSKFQTFVRYLLHILEILFHHKLNV